MHASAAPGINTEMLGGGAVVTSAARGLAIAHPVLNSGNSRVSSAPSFSTENRAKNLVDRFGIGSRQWAMDPQARIVATLKLADLLSAKAHEIVV
jgi:hypothetical protein